MSDSVISRPPAGVSSSSANCASAAKASARDAASPELTLAVLAAHGGLALAPPHLAELVDAYRYVGPMLGRIRRGNARADEPAHIFVAKAFDQTA
ncbi:hypothetical protein [Bordetella sp. LUAb4]|uniref:hypothetical protein n=1 Tax=Bordetella sp. LUAb4 TaxID=2843195 RepID=UPI001E2F71FD|nr:hypothetical protein [Bordetella sp. LUAb4]